METDDPDALKQIIEALRNEIKQLKEEIARLKWAATTHD